ncbi:MAG: acetylglutamate kinase [Chloroflexi bacterium]|nr:acetylglutamate kinase [Chloroflexota bacterium]
MKIGGSTLGAHDTTLEDLVSLSKRGLVPVVVHGGGKVITEWMERQGTMPRFVRGLRVTDERSMEVVVAVLAGLVNKGLVATLTAMGARAVGISGADGGLLKATQKDPELGLVGEVTHVDPEPILGLMKEGYMPVVAPVAIWDSPGPQGAGSLLNINGDTAAAELAAALSVEKLVFLTDVEGVLDSSRRLIPRLTVAQARSLVEGGGVSGGMIPKLEACLRASRTGARCFVLDGRRPKALLDCIDGNPVGTMIS